jgi:hypothetical protein
MLLDVSASWSTATYVLNTENGKLFARSARGTLKRVETPLSTGNYSVQSLTGPQTYRLDARTLAGGQTWKLVGTYRSNSAGSRLLAGSVLSGRAPQENDLGDGNLNIQVSRTAVTNVAGAPPIRTVSVTVGCDSNSRFANNDLNQITEVFRQALLAATSDYTRDLVAPDAGEVLYGQVRLLASTGNQLNYDLITSMLPVTQLVEEFMSVYNNALQSEDSINLDPSNDVLTYEFTFVRPNQNQVTLPLVHATTSLFRERAVYGRGGRSRGRSVLPSLLANRRFLIHRESNFSHRTAKQRRAMSLTALRSEASAGLLGDRRSSIQDLLRLNPQILEERERVQGVFQERREAALAGRPVPRRPEVNRRPRAQWSEAQIRAFQKFQAALLLKRSTAKSPSDSRRRKNLQEQTKRRLARARELKAQKFKANALKRKRNRSAYIEGKLKKMKKSKKKHGIYEDLKKRIFHHGCIGDFYNYSKAVLCVPTIPEEGFCLAMAFIRSQAIMYNLETGDVQESVPNACSVKGHLNFELAEEDMNESDHTLNEIMLKSLDEQGHLVVYNDREELQAGLKYHFETAPRHQCLNGGYSFFAKDEENHVAVNLFNPVKPHFTPSQLADQPLDTLKYAKQVPKEEIQAWYAAAQTFHDYVVREVRVDLPELPYEFFDPNKEQILQYYSNITQTIIVTYRVEMQGKRNQLYIPENFNPDLRKQKIIKVVSLLFSDIHADAITSLREFLKSKASANRSGINNYCLVCESLQSANNQSAKEGKEHFLKCLAKEEGVLKCACQKLYARRQVNRVTPVQFFQRKKEWYCRTCMEVVEGGIEKQNSHICQINRPEKVKLGKEEEIFVYDFECAQIDIGNKHFKHKVNLVCVRSVYPDKSGNIQRALFHTIEEFMLYIMKQKDSNRIYLAHNGGRYDVQFIMHHLEKHLIPHTFIPAPSSMHAYLSVTIPFGAGISSTFLDFRNFMPGSLKGIAQSFGLSLSKGDFPHRFNNGYNDEYIGALPLLYSDYDYWCLESKKSQEDVDEFITFYQEQSLIYCTCEHSCTCLKIKWDFKEQITSYCWLDVDVLAEACQRYRDNALEFGSEIDICGWKSKGIDPFQYLTIPQLAINLLLGGMAPGSNLTITPIKFRAERVPNAIAWMEKLMQHPPYPNIQHAGNSNREYYSIATERFFDGYDSTSHHVYLCLNCHFHACGQCCYEEIQTSQDHPTRFFSYSAIHHDTIQFLDKLLKYYGSANVTIVWEHALTNQTPYEQELGQLMDDREMFFGGRTEAFTPYIDMKFNPEDELKYHDVCSLYPFVCAFKLLPTGNPIHLCGVNIQKERILNITHPDPYFGYVRCTVEPDKNCLLGLLPMRCPESGRLEFPLTTLTGTWGTQELNLAIRNGYKVTQIYEVYHWTASERSDTALRGYIAFFMQMKQEAEGWKKLGASSENPSEEEKEYIIENTYQQSGQLVRIRKEMVIKNPVKRQMSKLFLNSLWGKFCQKKQVDSYTVIHSYQQFADLWFDPRNDQKGFAFRHLGGTSWKVRVRSKVQFTTSNRKYNIFLAAKVTEWARCILHERMLLIGPKRILYCDTDSIMFIYPKHLPKLDGAGLGNWIDEYPEDTITRLFAIAPKFYYLEMENEHHSLLKSKGIQMTHGNKRLITAERLGLQLLELLYPKMTTFGEKKEFENYIGVKNMLMGVNSINAAIGYGTMLTKYTADKRVRPVFSKRQFVSHSFDSGVDIRDISNLLSIYRIYTIPHGYNKTVEEVSQLVYRHDK